MAGSLRWLGLGTVGVASAAVLAAGSGYERPWLAVGIFGLAAAFEVGGVEDGAGLRVASVVTTGVGWVALAAATGFLAPVPIFAKWLLGSGWTALSVALAAAFVAHRHLATWLAREPDHMGTSSLPPGIAAHTALPWLVLAGFVLSAASILVGV